MNDHVQTRKLPVCALCRTIALTAVFIFSLGVHCDAQSADRDEAIASDDIRNTQQNAPLHTFKDHTNSTTGKLALYTRPGGLFDDDPAFKTKKSLWSPTAEIIGINLAVWGYDRFVKNYDYAQIGLDSWKNSFANGWEWDNDQLYMNFIMHPLAGGLYFNAARSNGYSFYESIPFTFGGALVWEYLGETCLPSYNDILTTTLDGILVGEIMYRLSSNILDDTTSGAERIMREFFAGVVDPVRGLNRLMDGTTKRTTKQEIYQKEPVSLTASFGSRIANEGSSFGSGTENKMVDLNLQYGDPFEIRARRPFDYFTLWGNMYFGTGYKLTDNIAATGLLYGRNHDHKNLEMLVGIFQHYHYWDSATFELTTIAFGGGLLTKLPLGRDVNLFTNFHLSIVPLAGNSTRTGPAESEFRDYDYSNGIQSEIDSALKIGRLSLAFAGYSYCIRSFVGEKYNNYTWIFKPRISFDLTESISIGFEQMYYSSDWYPADSQAVHQARTEQKYYISYFFRDFRLDD